MDRAIGALLPSASASGLYTHNYRDVTYASLFAHANLPPVQANAFASFGDITMLKGDALQGTVSATVRLVNPASWAALGAARDSFRSAEATLEVTEAQLLFSAGSAFFALAGAEELVVARKHAVEIARATFETAKARLEAGLVNKPDVSRAQLSILHAQQALREAADAREEARRSVATALGLREPFRSRRPQRWRLVRSAWTQCRE